MPRKRKKRESPTTTIARVAEAAPVVAKSRPQRETVVIHTTRERKRNAGPDGKTLASAAAMGGGSVAGGAASVVVAEQAKMNPFWASVVTSGTTLALAQLAKKIPLANKALIGASLGAGGLCGVHLIANYYAKKQHAQSATSHDGKTEKRHAEGDAVSRGELNDALSRAAEQQNQTTGDLMTALREEIKADMRSVLSESHPWPTKSPAPDPRMHPNLIRVTSFRDAVEDDYARNAYGAEDERNAEYGERDADPWERDADPWERDASVDERDAGVDERDADPWERDASADERDADTEWERNAEERDAFGEERDAFVDERDAGAELE